MFKAENFKADKVKDLILRLCTGYIASNKKPIITKEKAEQMTPEEIRKLFAECVNNGTLKFSTYTHQHLNKRLK